jgi:hypothetical protein
MQLAIAFTLENQLHTSLGSALAGRNNFVIFFGSASCIDFSIRYRIMLKVPSRQEGCFKSPF